MKIKKLNEAFNVDTVQKRIARHNEFDNGHVLHNYEKMTSAEAEEKARLASIENPDDIYYVSYDNIMNPSSDIKWKNGKQVTNEQLEADGEDGWGDAIEETLEELFDKLNSIQYEVNNRVRGSYGVDGNKVENLVSELEEVQDMLNDKIWYLKHQSDELNETFNDNWTQRFSGMNVFTNGDYQIKSVILANGQDGWELGRWNDSGRYNRIDVFTNIDKAKQKAYDLQYPLGERLNETSYGGAFDIADDQYFTREDLNDFAEEVLNHINETFVTQFDISACYIDNGVLELEVTNSEYGDYDWSEKIDMRKIKEPWHLKKTYASWFASQLINEITQSNNGLIESKAKELKEELWDKSRVTDLVTYYLDRGNTPINTLGNLIKSQMEKEGSKLPYNVTDFYDQLYMAVDRYNAQFEESLKEGVQPADEWYLKVCPEDAEGAKELEGLFIDDIIKDKGNLEKYGFSDRLKGILDKQFERYSPMVKSENLTEAKVFGHNIIHVGDDLTSKSGHKIHIEDIVATLSPFEKNAIVTFYYTYEMTNGETGSSQCSTFDLQNMLNESKSKLKEGLAEDAMTASRYLDFEIPEICKGVLDLIEHFPTHKLTYINKLCRDFYAKMESLIHSYTMEGDNYDESLTEDVDTEIKASPEEGPKFGLSSLLNNAIQEEFKTIDTYNSLAVTARDEGFEDIAVVVDEINTEENKHVGQLQALLKTIAPNAAAIDEGDIEAGKQLNVTESFDDEDFDLATEFGISDDDDISEAEMQEALAEIEKLKEGINNSTDIPNNSNDVNINDIEEEVVDMREAWEDIYDSFKKIEVDLKGDGEAITATIDKLYQDNKGNPDFKKAYDKWASGN